MSENETTNTSSLRGASTSQYDVAVSSTRDTSTVGGIISHNNAIRMAITPLMCVEVAAIVPPSHQALLRCAGSVGVDVYEELVARGKTPLYIECSIPKGGSEDGVVGAGTTHRVPTTLPFANDTEQIDDTAVLVVTHEHLAGSDRTLNALNVHPMRRLRYIGGGGESEPGLDGNGNRGCGVDKLESIEFCGVENVRHIPERFMFGCCSVTSVDFSPFKSLTSIGSFFLYGCASLTSLDTSPMVSITEVGKYHFMFGCSSLTSIDLGMFTNTTEVGTLFLHKCSSLTTVDLTPLGNVKTVGEKFMTDCTSLTSIDLSPLKNVTTIGEEFLGGCSSLTTVDLSPLTGLITVDSKTFIRAGNALAPAARRQFEQALKDKKKMQNTKQPAQK